MDSIINTNIKKGARVFIPSTKEYGTITGVGLWRGQITYTVLVDEAPDQQIFYPEEFTVLESEEY